MRVVFLYYSNNIQMYNIHNVVVYPDLNPLMGKALRNSYLQPLQCPIYHSCLQNYCSFINLQNSVHSGINACCNCIHHDQISPMHTHNQTMSPGHSQFFPATLKTQELLGARLPTNY